MHSVGMGASIQQCPSFPMSFWFFCNASVVRMPELPMLRLQTARKTIRLLRQCLHGLTRQSGNIIPPKRPKSFNSTANRSLETYFPPVEVILRRTFRSLVTTQTFSSSERRSLYTSADVMIG